MTIVAFNRPWVFHWPWVMIVLFVVTILLSLSLWQLQRAVQKEHNLSLLEQWQGRAAVSLNELLVAQQQQSAELNDGRSVAFHGRWFAPYIWLLNNKKLNGRAGYDVVIPVHDINAVAHSTIALVNLGWVAASADQNELPYVEIPDAIFVEGVYRTNTDGLLLGKNIEDHDEWPMRIQKIDNHALASYLPDEVMAGIIYQQQHSPFVIHYKAVTLSPERHRAYALQWLLLAVGTLLVGAACARSEDVYRD